jgi:signal transduction histidine kinase
MSSSDSVRAPRRRDSVRVASGAFTTRMRLKPRRDALTRVRHDLRSLLHTVLGYSALLKTEQLGSLNEQQKTFVSHVQTAALEIEQLVDVWLELSRPGGTPTSGITPPISFTALLARARHHVQNASIACGPWLSGLPPERSLAIDPDLFDRAILELARTVTRDTKEPCVLRVHETAGRVCISVAAASDAQSGELQSADALDNELSNRDFVRLKLSEVLLTRAGVTLLVSSDARYAELTLP